MTRATGGPPETVPAAYATRSPASLVPELNAWPGALLMAHGTDDPLVPLTQSCLLASRMGEVRAWYRDAVRPLPGPPPGCTGIAWRTDGLPAPSWPERRYLMVYRGAGHDLGSASAAGMLADVLSFLAARGT